MSKYSKKRKIKRVENEIITINKRKCIACTACAINCTKITSISVLKLSQPDKKVIKPKKETFNDSGCIYCGQCTLYCPTGAIDVRDDIKIVEEAINNKKYMIAIFAPALKATLGEMFNNPIGTNVASKLATSARLLGFNKVFETDFGADVTVVEEAKELYNRINNNSPLPMFTSCCPAWIKWVERFKRELLPYISTTKSPQQIMGAAIKTYFCEKNNLNPKDVFIVSIKPCTAKKFEADRLEMGRADYRDIDAVLTTREYSELLKSKGININDIPKGIADKVLGEYSGAGVIFGSSGGVLRASLRTLGYYLKYENFERLIDLKLQELPGFSGVYTSEYNIDNRKYKIAAISGISNVARFIESGEWKEYTFIEVMACPGGCINGGGSPKIMRRPKVKVEFCISCGTCIQQCPVKAIEFNFTEVATIDNEVCVGCTLCSTLCRSNAITMENYDKATGEVLTESYINIRKSVLEEIDKKSEIRLSHENYEVKELYKEYLGEIGGKKAEELLHISYNK